MRLTNKEYIQAVVTTISFSTCLRQIDANPFIFLTHFFPRPIIQGEHRKQRVRTNLFCRIQLIDQPAFDITKIILNCKPLNALNVLNTLNVPTVLPTLKPLNPQTFKRLIRPKRLERPERTLRSPNT